MGVCRFYIHLRPGLRGEIQHLLLYIGIIDMAVNIQGDAGRGVAHEVLHAFDIQPAADQAGAEGVAQDVRGEGGDGDTGVVLLEPAAAEPEPPAELVDEMAAKLSEQERLLDGMEAYRRE